MQGTSLVMRRLFNPNHSLSAQYPPIKIGEAIEYERNPFPEGEYRLRMRPADGRWGEGKWIRVRWGDIATN